MYLLIIFFLILIIPFLVMPRYITKSRSSYEAVIMSDIVICAAAAVIFMVQSITGDGMFTQLHNGVQDIAGVVAKDSNVISLLGMEELSAGERTDLVVRLYDEVFKLLPVSILIFGAVMSYIVYILLSRSLNRRSPVNLMPKFREFSVPSGAVFVLIGIYLLVWMLTATETFSDNSYYVNIDLLFDFVFFLQGMSAVFMLFYLKRIPSGFALVLCIVLWNIYIGRTMIVVIGMFDVIFGLKGKMLANNGRNQRK